MSHESFTYYPTFQIRSKSIIYYNRFEFNGKSQKLLNLKIQATQQLLESVKYSGQVTSGSKKRLTKAISLLIQSTKPRWIKNPVTKKSQYFQLSFITLTIPNQDKAKDAKFTHKNLLEPMLRVLRRRHQLKSYVWKAELQANGSVHYHLTSDIWINHTELRNEWNAILTKNGLLDGYYSENGNYNANSTDIHSVKKVKNMEAYLVKYVTKEYQNSVALNGKVWDCSRNLKASKYWTIEACGHYEDKINKEIEKKNVSYYSTENFTIYQFNGISVKSILNNEDRNAYEWYMQRVANWERERVSATMSVASPSGTSVAFRPPPPRAVVSPPPCSAPLRAGVGHHYQPKLF